MKSSICQATVSKASYLASGLRWGGVAQTSTSVFRSLIPATNLRKRGSPMRSFLMVLLVFTSSVGKSYATGPLNGGFETGDFIGWSTLGDTIVVNSSFGIDPFEGSFQALMSNGPGAPNVFNPSNVFTYSGTDSVSGLSLEGFFGLPVHALNDFSQSINLSFVFEGSGIKQSFTTNTTAVLTFHWNFLTDEAINSLNPPFLDFGFYVLDGNIGLLTQSVSPSNTVFLDETGYRDTSVTLSPGSHTLGLGVVDTGDPSVNSALLVDGVSISSVPEPSTLGSLGFGIVVLLARRIRMMRRH